MKVRVSALLLCVPLMTACTYPANSTKISPGMWWQNRKAEQLRDAGRCRDAIPIWEKLVAVLRKERGYESIAVASMLHALGSCKITTSELADAERLFNEALQIKMLLLGSEHQEVGMILHQLAFVQHERGDLVKAEKLYQESLRIKMQHLGSEHPSVAKGLNNLGTLKQERGQLKEAEGLFREALGIWKKSFSNNDTMIAATLNSIGSVKEDLCELDAAERLFRESLRITEALRSHEHADSAATSINNLSSVKQKRGQFKEAEDLLHASLRITENWIGHESPKVAMTLNNLGILKQRRGHFKEAEALFRESLRITEKVFDFEHPSYVIFFGNLGLLKLEQGQLKDAELLFRKARRIIEKSQGHENIKVAQLLNRLGNLELERSSFKEAENLFREDLRITEALLGHEHTDVATSLDSLASLKQQQGQFAEAENLFRESLRIIEKLLGHENLSIAAESNHLAVLKQEQGHLKVAEDLLRESLRITETLLGHEHINVATILDNLGELKRVRGELKQAEPLLRESLRITEKFLGHEDSNVASTLNHVGLVKLGLGEFKDAEYQFREALRINEQLLGHEHTGVAICLNNLGLIKLVQAELKEAEGLFLEALRIDEKALGHEHPRVATDLFNLGLLKREHGDLLDAEALLRESLRIDEKLHGSTHRNVAKSLYVLATMRDRKDAPEQTQRDLLRVIDIIRTVESPPLAGEPQESYADLLRSQGRTEAAEAYYKEAVQFARLSPDTRDKPLPKRLKSLGRFYQESERYFDATKAFAEAIELLDKQGERVPTDLLAWYSEVLIAQGPKSSRQLAEARKWISRALRQDLDELQGLILAVDEKELDRRLTEQAKRVDFLFGLLNKKDVAQEQRQFALAVSLARKALFIAVDASGAQALHAALPESVRGELEQLRSLWQEESKWSIRSQHPQSLGDANVQNIYRATVEKRRALQKRLMNMLPAQYRQVDVVFDESLQSIAKQLRPGEVFLDLVLHFPPQFSTRSKDPRPPSSQGRYHAFLLYPDGHVVDRDLGPAKDIDAALKEMSRALDNGERSVSVIQRAAQTAYRLTLAPLAPHLQEAKKIYVAADGEFVRHQLGLLHDSRGYLIDRFIFSPLNSGRDLLPTTAPRSDAHGIYALVNPSIRSPSRPFLLASMRSTARSGCLPDFSKWTKKLRGSGREGAVIGTMFHGAQVFEHEQASEEQLLRIKQPLLLHLGTHGMDCSSTAETRRGVRSVSRTLQAAATEAPDSSVLFLAGAEHYLKLWLEKRIETGVSDGLLTFAELARMDLRGTQLVVLAACLSGMGAVRRGQGLLGLRSALFVAGAETVVTTLGKVNDAVTAQLMTAYYQHLKDGEGRISALRSAALEIKRQHPHPFYWAPFLAVGRDEPLRLNP